MFFLHETDDIVVSIEQLFLAGPLENSFGSIVDLFLSGGIGVCDIVLKSVRH